MSPLESSLGLHLSEARTQTRVQQPGFCALGVVEALLMSALVKNVKRYFNAKIAKKEARGRMQDILPWASERQLERELLTC